VSQKPQRAIKRAVAAGRDDYELHDQEWQKIGLAAPARRALVDAKLYKVSDMRKITLTELSAMHGMGKSAIARIKLIMEAKKISFRM
jgi:hypothetical protein